MFDGLDWLGVLSWEAVLVPGAPPGSIAVCVEPPGPPYPSVEELAANAAGANAIEAIATATMLRKFMKGFIGSFVIGVAGQVSRVPQSRALTEPDGLLGREYRD